MILVCNCIKNKIHSNFDGFSKKNKHIFVHIIRHVLAVDCPSRRDSAFRDCATINRTPANKGKLALTFLFVTSNYNQAPTYMYMNSSTLLLQCKLFRWLLYEQYHKASFNKAKVRLRIVFSVEKAGGVLVNRYSHNLRKG